MASYNGQRWIEAQIASIRAQTDVAVSITACDDGSTDQTVAMLEAFRARGASVAIHRSVARAGSAGQNFLRLIREVDADAFDFVALSDQDDVWYPARLRHAIDRLKRDGADACSSAVRAVWADGSARLLRQVAQPTEADYLFEGAGQGCTFVFRTAAFHSLQTTLVGHERMTARIHYHDWLLYALARVLGMHWSFDAEPCMDYRQHASNDTGARGSGVAARKRLKLIRSGWYGRQIDEIASICAAVAPHIPEAAQFRRLSDSALPWGRWRQLAFVWSKGRRKPSDRLVLLIAAAAGWLQRPGESARS